MKPLIRHVLPVAAALVLLPLCYADTARAGWQADVGHAALVAELGNQAPDGSTIPVCQVEASVTVDGVATWMPDSSDAAFSGKTLNDRSNAPDGVYSSHATGVGKPFYGLSTSMAPGITTIDVYSVNNWAQTGGLRLGTTLQPRIHTCRLANHSWVGSALATTELTGEMLRRLDWLVDRDGYPHVVGMNNSAGANTLLLATAFNVMTAGRTDGSHSRNTMAVDSVYTGGRIRPDLVAPASCTSSAVPMVAGAATLLMQTAHAHPGLATDPHETSMTTRTGETRYNGERPEVVRALLTAGADRFTRNTGTTANIADYRLETANQTANGLDARYGAGQLNIQRSFHILMAGEQNSAEDGGAGVTNPLGFDYDPAFGGASGSNIQGTYTLIADGDQTLLTAALVWHVAIDGGTASSFSGTATLYDLNLELEDLTNGSMVSQSTGTADNSEHLWHSLTPGHIYALRVLPADGSAAFNHDYALAWEVQADADQDLIPDALDNCRDTGNRTQLDSDDDGYGNACDCDLENNGWVDAGDYWRWRLLATIDPSTENWNPSIDFNGNGKADAADLAILQARLGQAAPYH